jgi:CheY-like chemotaxis protein
MRRCFAFEDAGYRVVQASSADEALVALDRHPEIRVIFTRMVGGWTSMVPLKAHHSAYVPKLIKITSIRFHAA